MSRDVDALHLCMMCGLVWRDIRRGGGVGMKKCASMRSARSHELPFVIAWDGKPVTGKIDRLGELDGGSWAVIDYTSEAAAGPEGHAVLTEEYRKSMVI